MNYISSKDIFFLIKDSLRLLHDGIMDHSYRTGYIFYRMLQEKGGYEKYELAEWAMLATLHDIGAFKTNRNGDFMVFEIKDVMPHSVYGYLFLKNMSPMSDRSKVLLYHNQDYERLHNMDYIYAEEAQMLSLAERIDIYRATLGDKFQISVLDKYKGTKVSEKAMNCFMRAEEKHGILKKLDEDTFGPEMEEAMEFLLFTNQEKKKFMEMLMHCLGFRSRQLVVDSVTCVCICDELARYLGLDDKAKDKLFYAALLHDIGMIAIPTELIETRKALAAEEAAVFQTHVEKAESIAKDRIDKEILGIITAHHERLTGTGYPKGLTENSMSLSMKILQVADMVSGLINNHSRYRINGKEDVVALLKKEIGYHYLAKQVVDPFISSFHEISQKVLARSDEILRTDKKMEDQFHQVCQEYGIL